MMSVNPCVHIHVIKVLFNHCPPPPLWLRVRVLPIIVSCCGQIIRCPPNIPSHYMCMVNIMGHFLLNRPPAVKNYTHDIKLPLTSIVYRRYNHIINNLTPSPPLTALYNWPELFASSIYGPFITVRLCSLWVPDGVLVAKKRAMKIRYRSPGYLNFTASACEK